MSLGTVSAIYFMLVVNEPDLVTRSKYIYDKYFLIVEDQLDSDGKLLDVDDEFTDEDSDSKSPHFGNIVKVKNKALAKKSELSPDVRKEKDKFTMDDSSDDNITEFFKKAKENADRQAKSQIGVSPRDHGNSPSRWDMVSRHSEYFDAGAGPYREGNELNKSILGVKVELHQGDNDSMMDSEDFPKTFEKPSKKNAKKVTV